MISRIRVAKGYGYRAVRPLLSMLRPGNVAMFHIGRCGSSVLASQLRGHPQIFWDGELYCPIFREWRDANNGEEKVGEMPQDPYAILRSHMRQAGYRWYGAEFKPFHFRLIRVEMEHFVRHLQARGFSHFILLDRRNRLRAVVSAMVAQKTGTYQTRSKERPTLTQVRVDPGNVRIDFDSKSLLQYLSDYDAQIIRLQELLGGQEVLKLTYEDDIEVDPTKAYRRVCEFLGLPTRAIAIELSRINPFPVSGIVSNFHDVREVLQGTRYEWMLYE